MKKFFGNRLRRKRVSQNVRETDQKIDCRSSQNRFSNYQSSYRGLLEKERKADDEFTRQNRSNPKVHLSQEGFDTVSLSGSISQPNITLLAEDREALSKLGFDVQKFINSGSHGIVYEGICNENATKLYLIDHESEIQRIVGQKIWEFKQCQIDRSVVCQKTVEGVNTCEMCDIMVYFGEKSIEGEKFAVKYLSASKNPSFGDPLYEAKILMTLKHPNIVDIYYTLTTEHILNENFLPRSLTTKIKTEKRIYIVMEYMDITLSEYLDSDPQLNDMDMEYFMTALTDGLAYLHNNNICHNDIHEGNVMIRPDSEGLILVKYVDFGLSYILGSISKDILTLGTVLSSIIDWVEFENSEFANQIKEIVENMCGAHYDSLVTVIRDFEIAKNLLVF